MNPGLIGAGIVKGLVQTARNFAGSFTDPARLPTIEYPEERQKLPENSRQFPFLVYDGEDPMAGLRCVACQICEKECPPKCIYIVKSKDKHPDYKGQQQFYPAIFDIDYSVCMSCQICVEVCPFESIKMDTNFEWSRSDRFAGLLVHKEQLAMSNAHYQAIHPTDAAASDAVIAAEKAKAEAKAKAAAAAKAAQAAKPAAPAATATPTAAPAKPAPTPPPTAGQGGATA
jgi:NADH-quinone oxidoreductase subunit I